MTDNLERQSDLMSAEAEKIVARLGVVSAWESVGATVRRVGSSATGLMMNHRDIDFHVYSDELDAARSFQAAAKIAAVDRVERAVFVNLAETEEACFEWHVWYRDDNRQEWQIDMIEIRRGSKYDGYFERVAERIRETLTPVTRRAILALKNETPEEEKIAGVLYYQAVLHDGVRTWDEFLAWRQTHGTSGVIEWIP